MKAMGVSWQGLFTLPSWNRDSTELPEKITSTFITGGSGLGAFRENYTPKSYYYF